MDSFKSLIALVLVGLLGCSASAPDNAGHNAASPPIAPLAVLGAEDTQDLPEPPVPRTDSAGPTLSGGPTFSAELTQGGYIRGQAPADAVSVHLGGQALELSDQGAFFAAFDRDSPAQLDLTFTLANGTTMVRPLAIAPRAWQISRVNVPIRPGGSSETWWEQRKPEWEAITAARAVQTDAQGWTQDFIWPVKGRISGLFGRQRIYNGEPGSYHSGIDIAPGHGVPYVAPADGVVVLARTGFSLEGGIIILDHGAGLNSAFLHSSHIAVKEGDAVRQGQHIGNVGSSGRATGPHLHWSLKWHDARLDPLLFTGPMD